MHHWLQFPCFILWDIGNDTGSDGVNPTIVNPTADGVVDKNILDNQPNNGVVDLEEEVQTPDDSSRKKKKENFEGMGWVHYCDSKRWNKINSV